MRSSRFRRESTECAPTPLRKDGSPSTRCKTAEANATVVAESTTEIVVVSECTGSPNGDPDIVATLNDPPSIDGITIDPSKFITTRDTNPRPRAAHRSTRPLSFRGSDFGLARISCMSIRVLLRATDVGGATGSDFRDVTVVCPLF